MRILPSSNVGRTRGNRRAASRTLLVESLSSRVVLSGGGWGELAAGGLEPLRAEVAFDRQESVAVQQAFAEIAANKTPMEMGSPADGIVRREAYSDSGFVMPKDSPGGLWRDLPPAHSMTQSFGATAPTLYSVNFVLGPNVIWTVVVDASVVAAQMGMRDGAPPAHIWDKGPGYDGRILGGGLTDGLAAPQVSLAATQAHETPQTSAEANTRGSDSLANAILASFAPTSIDVGAKTAGGFLPFAPPTSTMTTPPERSSQSEFTLSPDRQEASQADRDGGLIELETPAERRRKLALKGIDGPADEELSAERLRRLLEQVWAGWDQAWSAWQEVRRAAGNRTPMNQAQLSAALPPDASGGDAAASADAEIAAVEGGLIELTAEGPVDVAARPKYMAEHAHEGERIRIDAGMALHQSFEVATAAEAVAPTTAKNAQAEGTEAGTDSSAKAKNSPSETKRPSAALMGTGLLLSLPFSVFRVHQQDGNVDRARKRPHLKVDRLD